MFLEQFIKIHVTFQFSSTVYGKNSKFTGVKSHDVHFLTTVFKEIKRTKKIIFGLTHSRV